MIAITGATGAVGGRLARQVADLEPRLIVRDPARAPDLAGEAVPEEPRDEASRRAVPEEPRDEASRRVRTATYDDAEAMTAAFEGVDVAFLVSAAESATRREQHRTAIRAAADAGVRHLVYTSFAGASPDATFTLGRDHADAEAAIRDSGMEFTLLRDNFYLDVLPLFADAEGVIRGPAGSGRVAAVARADVADVAADVLRFPADHAGATYTLTGPEALTLAEVAERASRVLGRPLRYEEETVEEAYASRRAGWPGTPDWQLDAWVSTYTAIADGSVAEVSDDVRLITEHPPRSLEDALRS